MALAPAAGLPSCRLLFTGNKHFQLRKQFAFLCFCLTFLGHFIVCVRIGTNQWNCPNRFPTDRIARNISDEQRRKIMDFAVYVMESLGNSYFLFPQLYYKQLGCFCQRNEKSVHRKNKRNLLAFLMKAVLSKANFLSRQSAVMSKWKKKQQ